MAAPQGSGFARRQFTQAPTVPLAAVVNLLAPREGAFLLRLLLHGSSTRNAYDLVATNSHRSPGGFA